MIGPSVNRVPQPVTEWVAMREMSAGAITGMATSSLTGYGLVDAAQTTIACTCPIPEYAIAGTAIQTKIWIASSTGGANIVLTGHTQVRADGSASNAAVTSFGSNFNATTHAITANLIKELTTASASTVVPGDLFHFRWYREGAHANDNLAATVVAIGTWAGFSVLR